MNERVIIAQLKDSMVNSICEIFKRCNLSDRHWSNKLYL